MRPTVAAVLAAALLTGTLAPAAEAPAERLDALVEGFFEGQLELNPVYASFVGDDRYDHRLGNPLSAEFRIATAERDRRALAELLSIDRSALEGQDVLSWDVFRRDREMAIEGERFPDHLIPINQFFSLPNFFAVLGSGNSAHQFRTTEDYDEFLGRIRDFGVVAVQAVANMRAGVERGVVQPRVLMERTLPQLAAHLVEDPEESVFWQPVAAFPDSVGEADRERLRALWREAILEQVVPAYRRLHDYIRDEYLPDCRETVGLDALPDGEAWYAYRVRASTTTEMTPDRIHDLGLAEVARIRAEMEAVMREVDFEGDLPAFFEFLRTDDRFYYEDEEALLQGYRDLQERINAALPRLFDVFPKADYEVRPVESFRAASAALASYQAASPDGSRPGVFYVNTHDLRGVPKYGMETLSLHEASPGHHFQVSIAREIEELPRFRRFGGYSAYSEGWALYAESLGKDLGLFEDPYQYYGRLNDEMLRAMRLVVDTGLHSKGWSREDAIAYMIANSSMPEVDAAREVERYIAIPGQALAYKVGALRIADLRARAERELGDDFDVTAFHREVLIQGPLPLKVLAGRIGEWIEAEH